MSHRSHHKAERGHPRPREPIEKQRAARGVRVPLATDFLILSDSTVLAHNLTPVMAAILHKLNPQDQTIKLRSVPARERLASSTADRRVGTPEFRR